MSYARTKPLATALVGLTIGAAGVAVMAQQNPTNPSASQPGQADQGKGAARPGQPPPKGAVTAKALAEARIETAREIVAQDMQGFEHLPDGNLLTEVPLWSRHLMEDRLGLATTPAQRIAAIREHRDRMRQMEQLTGGYAKAGQGKVSDALKARYFRLAAEQLLVEAGGDAGPVVLPTPPERKDQPPQPPPPPAPAGRP